MPLRVWLLILLLLAGWAGVAAWSLHVEQSARQTERDAEQQDFAAIRAALQRPIDLARETITLAEFARQIGKATGLSIELDHETLDGYFLNSSREIRSSRVTLPAGTALDLLLNDLELTYVIRDGQVVITTPDAAASEPPMVAVYPLPQPEMASSLADADAWLETITTLIAPEQWDTVGGPGHCEAVPGALLVVQQPRIQEQVRMLVERLSQLDDSPPSWQPVPLGPEWNNSPTRDLVAKLRQPAKIDCREMPLDELLEFLAQEHELPIVIDHRRLGDAGVSPRKPVTRQAAGTLESVLWSVLAELELTVSVQNGAVLITTPDRAEENLWVAAFPVQDLVTIEGTPDFTALIDLITATIRPAEWDTVGGHGSVTVLGGWLLVAQTRETLAKVEQLVAQLRRGLSGEEHSWMLATSTTHAATEQITRALEKEVPLDYTGTRLLDICADLAQQTGIRIELDHRPLREANLTGETRLSVSFPPAPLRMQLERLGASAELTVATRDEALLLTTKDDAEAALFTRLYDVRPLNGPLRRLGNSGWLIDLIEQHVAPRSWDNVGGPGSLADFRGLLVVSQTLYGHRELAALLAGLKKVTATLRVPSSEAPASIAYGDKRIVPVAFDSAAAAIRRRLAKPVDIDLCEAPLGEVAAEIARETGLRVRLEGTGSGESPITFSAYGMTLGGALERLLPENWDYEVRGRELVIALKDARRPLLRTQLYQVADVAPASQPQPAAAVQRMIQDGGAIAGLAEDAWDIAGGPGTITALPGDWIVVSAQDRIHGQIEDWLHERRTGEIPQQAKESRSLARQRADELKAREILQAEMERAQRESVERDP